MAPRSGFDQEGWSGHRGLVFYSPAAFFASSSSTHTLSNNLWQSYSATPDLHGVVAGTRFQATIQCDAAWDPGERASLDRAADLLILHRKSERLRDVPQHCRQMPRQVVDCNAGGWGDSARTLVTWISHCLSSTSHRTSKNIKLYLAQCISSSLSTVTLPRAIFRRVCSQWQIDWPERWARPRRRGHGRHHDDAHLLPQPPRARGRAPVCESSTSTTPRLSCLPFADDGVPFAGNYVQVSSSVQVATKRTLFEDIFTVCWEVEGSTRTSFFFARASWSLALVVPWPRSLEAFHEMTLRGTLWVV